jgi:hypothetical protein
MKSNFLLPSGFRKAGWCMFFPGVILGVLYLLGEYPACLELGGTNAFALFDGFSDTNMFTVTFNDSWTEEFIIILLALALLFIGFSREKDEDECIANIRMNALVWAMTVNTALLIASTLLIFGLPYLTFMSIYMFSLMVLFIAKYQWLIYRFRKNSNNDE